MTDHDEPVKKRRAASESISSKGILFMTLLALQFGSQPLLQAEFIDKSVNTTVVVLFTEVLKFIMAAMFMIFEGSLMSCLGSWRPLPSLAVAALPAVTYAMQNICIQTAYRNLDPLVFNLINQTKLLWAAVLTYLLLGRRQSTIQVIALLMLFVSAVLISLGQSSQSHTDGIEKDTTLGMMAIVAASALSGVGAAISELALRSYNRNSYLFSAELALYSALVVVISEKAVYGQTLHLGVSLATSSFVPISPTLLLLQGAFASCNRSVTQALGGILVGQVQKGFSIIGGILLTAMLRRLLLDAPLTGELAAAVPLTLLATYLAYKVLSHIGESDVSVSATKAEVLTASLIQRNSRRQGRASNVRKALRFLSEETDYSSEKDYDVIIATAAADSDDDKKKKGDEEVVEEEIENDDDPSKSSPSGGIGDGEPSLPKTAPVDSHENHRKTAKSIDFGEKLHATGTQSLEVFEFLSRMEAHLVLLNVPKEQWYQYLSLNTRGQAYNVLTNNVRCGISDLKAFQLGADVLRERFGLGIHDLWGLLRERKLSPGETTSDLMGDIQKYVTYSLPEVARTSRKSLDWLSCMCFLGRYPYKHWWY
ncbi:hypothetical protein FOL47_006782 [Perkinsus chesapeaki]|uniref:Uncharacterized protein n=1 Tax=Perkinsus chesapeaki TaxID=330153 RepID=A0A7J6LQC7_PERCH|nr:hypothetical protein FOL47_006782 [Perkinsus chesapeaki]